MKNYSTAIFVISDAVRAVSVIYDPDDLGGKNKIYKTLDTSIKADDFVVIPTNTRHKMTVAQIKEVDLEIDLESSKEVEWLLGRVDLAKIDEIKDQEKEAVTKIKKAEKRRHREQLRTDLTNDVGDDLMKSLPIFTGEGSKKE